MWKKWNFLILFRPIYFKFLRNNFNEAFEKFKKPSESLIGFFNLLKSLILQDTVTTEQQKN